MKSFACAAPSFRRFSSLLIPAALLLSGCATDREEDVSLDASASSSTVHPVNVNLASQSALAALPGIGDELAARIVDRRERYHLFAEPADLANVDGLGAMSVQPLLRSVITKLDIDTATESQIESLPMIGQAKAVAIVEWRNQHGAFASVDDLAKVPGVDAATVDAVRPYVKARHVTPNPGSDVVDVNDADLDTLEALPGVGYTRAQAIIDYRLAHGPFTRLDDLDNVPGFGSATVAELEPLLSLGLEDFENATFAVEGTWNETDSVGDSSSGRFADESAMITLSHGRITLVGACVHADACAETSLGYSISSQAPNGDFSFHVRGLISSGRVRARIVDSTGTVTSGTLSLDLTTESAAGTRTISLGGYRVLN